MAHIPGTIEPGTSPPLLIAHAGGNSPERTAAALAHAADYLEIDLWVHRDGFEARHERRLPFGLPWLYERWYLSPLRLHKDPLGRLLAAAHGRAGLFLDLKNGGETPSILVARALESLDDRVPVLASSQSWKTLRAFAIGAPSVPVYYSVDVVAKLDLLFSVVRRDTTPAGTSCSHRILTREGVERLHDEGLAVVAWTVDDEERALELADWGVDAITTHNPAELRRAFGSAP